MIIKYYFIIENNVKIGVLDVKAGTKYVAL
jgi:hypothetical protein